MTTANREHGGGESFRVELRALPDDHAPPIIRLRGALKCLLRSFGLQCTGVSETTPEVTPSPDRPAELQDGPTAQAIDLNPVEDTSDEQ